jgi:hypothetical protein
LNQRSPAVPPNKPWQLTIPPQGIDVESRRRLGGAYTAERQGVGQTGRRSRHTLDSLPCIYEHGKMSTTRWFAQALTATLMLGGCTGYTLRDNATQAEVIRKRAAFDLACPDDKLQIVQVETDSSGWVKTFGAIGCGQRASYVRFERASGPVWNLESAQQMEKSTKDEKK